MTYGRTSRRGSGWRHQRVRAALAPTHFSPHGLRRRRGSLYYKRTGSLADVAALLGDSKRVAADHYVYALTDYREIDRTIARSHAPVASPGDGPVTDQPAEGACLQGGFEAWRAQIGRLGCAETAPLRGACVPWVLGLCVSGRPP